MICMHACVLYVECMWVIMDGLMHGSIDSGGRLDVSMDVSMGVWMYPLSMYEWVYLNVLMWMYVCVHECIYMDVHINLCVGVYGKCIYVDVWMNVSMWTYRWVYEWLYVHSMQMNECMWMDGVDAWMCLCGMYVSMQTHVSMWVDGWMHEWDACVKVWMYLCGCKNASILWMYRSMWTNVSMWVDGWMYEICSDRCAARMHTCIGCEMLLGHPHSCMHDSCICYFFFPRIYPVISYRQCQMATVTQMENSYTLHVTTITTTIEVEKAT
jgi:hypothetical protein